MSWSKLAEGTLRKMQTTLSTDSHIVNYDLCLGDHKISLNELLGRSIQIQFLGNIFCQACGNKTTKSYGQGYCYNCFSSLAQCDICIMSPEKCHYAAGTCREPKWGQSFCMTDHIVYLANSSGLKVGITKLTQLPTRWMDQGAIQALPIFRVKTRYQSGLIEDILRQQITDKTNWRVLLRGNIELIDMIAERNYILSNSYKMMAKLQAIFGIQAVQPLSTESVTELIYPVKQYPSKIVTHNLDKDPIIQGSLNGIKGQYLLLDTGVINIRKYTAYQVIFFIK